MRKLIASSSLVFCQHDNFLLICTITINKYYQSQYYTWTTVFPFSASCLLMAFLVFFSEYASGRTALYKIVRIIINVNGSQLYEDIKINHCHNKEQFDHQLSQSIYFNSREANWADFGIFSEIDLWSISVFRLWAKTGRAESYFTHLSSNGDIFVGGEYFLPNAISIITSGNFNATS